MSDTAVAESRTRLQNFLDRAGLRGFPWKTATILYTISWGWLFIVRDSYWIDDWTVFYFGEASENRFTYGIAPWVGSIQVLFELGGPGPMRVLSFGFYFSAAILAFGISKHFSVFQIGERKFFVLLFLLLPFNSARVALMVFHYTSAYFLFFLAWYILVFFKKKWQFFLACILFFLSFQMHSLIFFFIAPVIHRLFNSRFSEVKRFPNWLVDNWLLLLMPLIYWIMRAEFWPEKVKYHDVSFSTLLEMTYFVFIFSVLLLVIFVMQLKLGALKESLQMIFAGVACIFLGIFAYVVLRFFPSNWMFFSKYATTFLGRSDWYSRHQTLQPLGVSLFIVGIFSLLSKWSTSAEKQARVFVVSICVLFNAVFGFEYLTDYAKQKEVISELIATGQGKTGVNFQFIDQTALLNARGRRYRTRDWQGLIWSAYGVETSQASTLATSCESPNDSRLVLIEGPETHWEALKNWVSDGDMGFEVTVDDTPGACKPEMVKSQRVSGAIPILFYFTGAKG